MFTIRPFAATDEDYQAITDVHNATWPRWPEVPDDFRRSDAHRNPEHLHQRLVAVWNGSGHGAGQIVAFGAYMHTSWSFHPQRFYIDIATLPEYRRRGIGSAIYDYAVEALSPLDPISIEANTREDVADGLRFVKSRGFELKTRQPISLLDPAAFDPTPFAGVDERVTGSGIRITTLRELESSDLDYKRKLYEAFTEIERDVPWHEEFTPNPYELWVKRFDSNPNRLPDGFFVALDGADIVGVSSLWGNQASDETLYTGLTGVVRSHRRRGIATALKLRAIEFAQHQRTARGTVPVIETDNEEDNPMFQINQRLGFVEQPAWLAFVKQLTVDQPAPLPAES